MGRRERNGGGDLLVERFKEPKPKTLEEEKEELEFSMKSSRHQEYVRKEMDKIRKEGKIKDLYEIINEAERRVNKNV